MIGRIKNSINSRLKTRRTNRRAAKKRRYQQSNDLGNPKAVIWIFGCQRSGTTFLENIFRHDLSSSVFGEFSELTIAGRRTVLREGGDIVQIVSNQNARYVVIRPLFESDRALELMNMFDHSVGVWMYREGPSVVDSMIRKWQGDFFSISKKVESDSKGQWRLEPSIDEIRTKAEPATIAEQYARYWVLRNSIPEEKGLVSDTRMTFLSYRKLASDPAASVAHIMKTAGLSGVWSDFRADARTDRIDHEPQLDIGEGTRERMRMIYQSLDKQGDRTFSL
jgi:hypothetical protein